MINTSYQSLIYVMHALVITIENTINKYIIAVSFCYNLFCHIPAITSISLSKWNSAAPFKVTSRKK